MANKTPASGPLSPEMTLLGLLHGGPGYGYDLHRQVAADLGQVWHLSQSQAYAILKRLEAQGDITSEEVPQEKLPPRQLLRITAQGRKRFFDWLDAPSGGAVRAIRMGFITRLYFLNRYFPQKVTAAFDRQMAEVEFHIKRLEKIIVDLPASQFYNYMSVEMRVRQLRAVLDWLDKNRKLVLPD
jgi:DNA-binding PadR family transcriptional regulator